MLSIVVVVTRSGSRERDLSIVPLMILSVRSCKSQLTRVNTDMKTLEKKIAFIERTSGNGASRVGIAFREWVGEPVLLCGPKSVFGAIADW